MGQTVLVLASSSPRRRELLPLLGLPCRILPVDVDERLYRKEDPLLTVVATALAKVRAVFHDGTDSGAEAGEIAVAADTLVVHRGRVLGKPVDAQEARSVLLALRGDGHAVASGVALRDENGREWAAVLTTVVQMRSYTDAEVEAYVGRGEPLDKAGGYAVQDRDFRPVERIEGCYLNVVGLPLCAVARGLEALGITAPGALGGPLLPPCALCKTGRAVVETGG